MPEGGNSIGDALRKQGIALPDEDNPVVLISDASGSPVLCIAYEPEPHMPFTPDSMARVGAAIREFIASTDNCFVLFHAGSEGDTGRHQAQARIFDGYSLFEKDYRHVSAPPYSLFCEAIQNSDNIPRFQLYLENPTQFAERKKLADKWGPLAHQQVAGCQKELDQRYGAGVWAAVDYAADFGALWGGEYAQNIVLFWDGMPVGLNAAPVDVEASLTPYDWALSFSRKLVGGSAAPNFRVVIYDISFGEMSRAFGVQMASVLESNFPWVSICRRLENLDKCIDHRELRRLEKTDKPILDLFAQIWINNLARNEDHHDVNNLLGPMLLLDGMGKGSSEHLGRSTMLFHVRRLGLIGPPQAEADAEKWLASARKAISEQKGNLRFILIDDQVDHGWADVIAGWLNVGQQMPARSSDNYTLKRWSNEGRTELWTCSSAKPLIDRLWKELRIAEDDENCQHPKDLRFRLDFSGFEDNQRKDVADQCQEILLLDLRLGRSGGIDRASLKQVVEIALVIDRRSSADRGYLRLVPSGEAWPQLGWPVEQWDAWLDAACSPDSEFHAISLGMLASVIATVDLAYPIIIFSSTGQREIVEKLRSWPTVLTDFEKPRILGFGASDWLYNAAMQWRDAILQADDILHVRRSVQRVMKAPRPLTAQLGTSSYRHLTIALDESGNFRDDENSALGGVIIETSGNTQLEAQTEALKFYEHLRHNGINFYDHVPAYSELVRKGEFVSGRPVRKGANVTRKLAGALSKFERCNLGSFRCIVQNSEYANDSFSGETYLKWLAVTLEALLAEYLPSLGWQNLQTSLSIWLPQRTVDGAKSEAQRLDFNQYNGKITTLGGRSVAYVIVARALEDRSCFEDVFSAIVSLKIRKIPYSRDVKFLRDKEDRRIEQEYYNSATEWYCIECSALSGIPTARDARIDPSGIEIEYRNGNYQYCSNHKGKFLAADFSVAAHLADSAVSTTSFPGRQLGKANIRPELSFDIQASERLIDFLQVGRLFDRGFPDDAFSLAYRNDFFVSGLNRTESVAAKAMVERRLVARLAKHVSRIDAAMIVDLAMLPRTRFQKKAD